LLRWLARRRSLRQLTRTGLLEYHYEKFLYGDTCLFQLPDQPRLYILATNLSEGCLCAFTRDGLIMQRRRPGQRFRFDRIHTGLATVPMAVTASSAFPGFFPPLELQGDDVGADPGQFGRLAFTDGGIYDNLGVRMFRCLEQSWIAREIRLEADDLMNADEAGTVLAGAAQSQEDSPLRRLAQMISLQHKGTARRALPGNSVELLIEGLDDVMKHENLAREPAFASLSLPDPAALPLLDAAQRTGGEIDIGEQLWLNRQLVEAALRHATGKPCFRSLNPCFDVVLVSDAGKQFKIAANTRAGGLIATGMRSTDIVMDRVWQLENDTFSGTPGYVFAPISKVVEPSEDPTALHPEVQRKTAGIRTDLDRFSSLEVSSLIRHGYCVGRSVCRSRPDLFGNETPIGTPWDPIESEREETSRTRATDSKGKLPATAPQTEDSRTLQRSAGRRLWSTMLDYRDWSSYMYVPLLVPILIVLPYYGVKWYHQSQVAQQLIESMAKSNSDYDVMKKLLQEGSSEPFQGMPVQEVHELTPPDYSGVEVIADMRVWDMRSWKTKSQQLTNKPSWAYGYRRIRLQKLEPTTNRFVVHLRMPTTHFDVRPRTDRGPTAVRLLRDTAPDAPEQLHVFEVEFDLSKDAVRDLVDLSFESLIRMPRPDDTRSTSLYVDTETGILSYWLLMPEDQRHRSFDLLRYPTGNASAREHVAPAYRMKAPNGRVLAFALLSADPGFIYECRWTDPD
jgi:hypothetical protein